MATHSHPMYRQFRQIGKRIPYLQQARRTAQRAKLALGYFRGPVANLLHWLVNSRETTNFTYHLEERNRSYLAAMLADVLGLEFEAIATYMDELERDETLRAHIVAATQGSPFAAVADAEARYGRRLGWYALARAMKPKVIVETGVDKGLGACVLTAALMRNAAEGHPGRYYGTDINPEAGFLLSGPYAEFGRLLLGDSIESLQRLDQTIDLFINDSDHSAEIRRPRVSDHRRQAVGAGHRPRRQFALHRSAAAFFPAQRQALPVFRRKAPRPLVSGGGNRHFLQAMTGGSAAMYYWTESRMSRQQSSRDGIRPMAAAEPGPDRFAGTGWQAWITVRFWATRPLFLSASVLPVWLGTAWGYRSAGSFDLLAFFLALAAVVAVHGSANVLNDVYDDRIGSDRHNGERIFPYTGGSRFIQNGVLTAEQMAAWGRQLLMAGLAFGTVLMLLKGQTVLALGLIGMALALAYSMPPLRLSDRGLGEIAVAAGFGVLPVMGASWLQTGGFDSGAMLLSLPVGCWIANVLLINEIPDAPADRIAGRRNWVVRYGIERAAWTYLTFNVAAAAFAGWMLLCGLVTGWAALGPVLLLFLAIPAARSLLHQGSSQIKPVIQITLAIHTLGSLWLTGWLLAARLL